MRDVCPARLILLDIVALKSRNCGAPRHPVTSCLFSSAPSYQTPFLSVFIPYVDTPSFTPVYISLDNSKIILNTEYVSLTRL